VQRLQMPRTRESRALAKGKVECPLLLLPLRCLSPPPSKFTCAICNPDCPPPYCQFPVRLMPSLAPPPSSPPFSYLIGPSKPDQINPSSQPSQVICQPVT
jgi:hypothetical protein